MSHQLLGDKSIQATENFFYWWCSSSTPSSTTVYRVCVHRKHYLFIPSISGMNTASIPMGVVDARLLDSFLNEASNQQAMVGTILCVVLFNTTIDLQTHVAFRRFAIHNITIYIFHVVLLLILEGFGCVHCFLYVCRLAIACHFGRYVHCCHVMSLATSKRSVSLTPITR